VLVVEARDRVGGRIWTDGPVELGAEFVHGRPAATLELLTEAGIVNVSAEGEHWEGQGGRFEPMADRLGPLHRMFDPLLRVVGDLSVATALDRALAGNPAIGPAAAAMRRLVEQFDAADPARASLVAILKEWSGGATVEANQGRPGGGYGRLIDQLVRTIDLGRIELRLRTVVRVVRWSSAGVGLDLEWQGDPSRVQARAAIITLPLGVLQSPVDDPAAVRFDPLLRDKESALRGLAMGPVLKVLLRYGERFWESAAAGRYREAAFFHSDEVTFRTFWTALPARTSWLTGWLAGPPAAELSAETDELICRRAAESVQRLFREEGNVSALLRESRLHNWQRDPRARGGYSYVTVGGAGARAELARPLAGTLFFAGEATEDSGEAGTVAGAIMSGTRAAEEFLA
jgi:monoamine oxidase